MKKGNWNEIKFDLTNVLEEIFYDYDLQKLSSYEKRKIIFEFLCCNLSYDYKKLNSIRAYNEGGEPVSRDPFLELSSVINNKMGICNGISQYYKLLLGEVGIAAYCVICDDGTPVRHQLNLVYDDSEKTYSFDDVTSVIVGRGITDEYFDYNLESANFLNQGNVEIMNDKKWVILPENYINALVGREKSFVPTLESLPTNIASVQNHSSLNKK